MALENRPHTRLIAVGQGCGELFVTLGTEQDRGVHELQCAGAIFASDLVAVADTHLVGDLLIVTTVGVPSGARTRPGR